MLSHDPQCILRDSPAIPTQSGTARGPTTPRSASRKQHRRFHVWVAITHSSTHVPRPLKKNTWCPSLQAPPFMPQGFSQCTRLRKLCEDQGREARQARLLLESQQKISTSCNPRVCTEMTTHKPQSRACALPHSVGTKQGFQSGPT